MVKFTAKDSKMTSGGDAFVVNQDSEFHITNSPIEAAGSIVKVIIKDQDIASLGFTADVSTEDVSNLVQEAAKSKWSIEQIAERIKNSGLFKFLKSGISVLEAATGVITLAKLYYGGV